MKRIHPYVYSGFILIISILMVIVVFNGKLSVTNAYSPDYGQLRLYLQQSYHDEIYADFCNYVWSRLNKSNPSSDRWYQVGYDTAATKDEATVKTRTCYVPVEEYVSSLNYFANTRTTSLNNNDVYNWESAELQLIASFDSTVASIVQRLGPLNQSDLDAVFSQIYNGHGGDTGPLSQSSNPIILSPEQIQALPRIGQTYYSADNDDPPFMQNYPNPPDNQTGTYDDPIKFAAAANTQHPEFESGKVIYIPELKKYFKRSDSCQGCQDDNDNHIDLWAGDASKACVFALGQATVHYITPDDPQFSNYAVDTTPFIRMCNPQVDPQTHLCPGNTNPINGVCPVENPGEPKR